MGAQAAAGGAGRRPVHNRNACCVAVGTGGSLYDLWRCDPDDDTVTLVASRCPAPDPPSGTMRRRSRRPDDDLHQPLPPQVVEEALTALVLRLTAKESTTEGGGGTMGVEAAGMGRWIWLQRDAQCRPTRPDAVAAALAACFPRAA